MQFLMTPVRPKNVDSQVYFAFEKEKGLANALGKEGDLLREGLEREGFTGKESSAGLTHLREKGNFPGPLPWGWGQKLGSIWSPCEGPVAVWPGKHAKSKLRKFSLFGQGPSRTNNCSLSLREFCSGPRIQQVQNPQQGFRVRPSKGLSASQKGTKNQNREDVGQGPGFWGGRDPGPRPHQRGTQ